MAEPSRSGTVYISYREDEIDDNSDGEGVFAEKEEGIDNLVKKSRLVIFETSSVLPIISPFRNKITITLSRVSITYNGLLTRDEYPMPIESVTGARIHQDFLFGTLYIDTFGIVKPEPLRYLRIKDARLARRYILALIEAKKANIPLPLDNIDDLRNTLKEIGTVRFKTSSPDYHKL